MGWRERGREGRAVTGLVSLFRKHNDLVPVGCTAAGGGR